MTIKLREYQEETIERTREAMRRHRSVLLRAPTGAGKTAMAAFMCHAAGAKRKRVYFLCHRQELLDQTSQTFAKVGIDHGFIASGYPPNDFASVQLCSIPTLARRVDRVSEPDLAIWDEAHHIAAASWAKVKARWGRGWHIGLTATPQRLDGRGLKDWFDTIVAGPEVSELMALGFLSDYRVFSHPTGANLDAVRIKMGDFDKRALAEQMSQKKLIGDLVAHYQGLGEGRRAVVFAVNISHSETIVERFRQAGIPAIHIDGNTPKEERRARLRDFALGKYQVVSNVALFGEGFDLAANAGMDVTVDVVISARPTMSLSLWLQQCGRALRPKADGSKALILDHAGNALRHGLPDDDREWTLEDRAKKPQAPRVRECPYCFAVVPIGTLRCPECEAVLVVPAQGPGDEDELEEEDGRLEERESEAQRDRRQMAFEFYSCRSYQDFVELGKKRGYKRGWARFQWNLRKHEIQEEEEAYSLSALIRLAKKRGVKNPEGWARGVQARRERQRRTA